MNSGMIRLAVFGIISGVVLLSWLIKKIYSSWKDMMFESKYNQIQENITDINKIWSLSMITTALVVAAFLYILIFSIEPIADFAVNIIGDGDSAPGGLLLFLLFIGSSIVLSIITLIKIAKSYYYHKKDQVRYRKIKISILLVLSPFITLFILFLIVLIFYK